MTSLDLLGEFADHVRSFIDLSKLRPLKVIADAGNGMGGLVVPAVFGGLPFDLEMMYAELDGTFPNHPPNPIEPENLKDLQARVLETGADVGLAFDGDADRVFLVDDKAQPVSGSTTATMVAAALLGRTPGATILYNLICSKALPEIVEEKGGKPIRTRVGHSFIKAVMADTGAIFGGEHSGHYYFLDNYRADSGLIASMVVMQLLSEAGEPLSELRKPFERYSDSGEINVPVDDDPHAVIDGIADAYPDAEQDRTDGLTVDLGDWWFNVRPSNTEPVLRLNLEAADDESCRAHVDEVLALMKRMGPHERQELMGLDARLLEILACPEDRGPLLYFTDEDSLYNPRLHRRYAVRDGIPIMLIDEAETVDDAEHGRLMAKAEADGVKPTFEDQAPGTPAAGSEA